MTHTNFKNGQKLGRGAFGKVYLCCDSHTGELFAVKEVKIDNIGGKREKELQAIMNEVEIMSDIRHERIVQYLGYQQGEQVLSIFLEYMPGKSLWQHMQDFGAVSENVTKKFTKQILEGLVFLHSEKIIHRDIKAGNILRDTQSNIKLSDFGISKQLRSITSVAGLKTSVGSPYWMAPEIIKEEGYGYNADLWSVGCTVVELLTTKPPFAELEHPAAVYKIATCEKPIYDLPSDSSKCLKRFLHIVFQTKSTNRTSAKKLLQHEFITSHSFKEVEPDQEAYSEDTLCEENNTIISQAALEQKDDDGKDKYDEHLHVTNVPQYGHKQEDGYDDKTCGEYTHRTNVSQSMTKRENGDDQKKCREHIIYNEVENGNSEKDLNALPDTATIKSASCFNINEIDKLNEVTLLLIGSTGTGKSATGNTILGSQAFQTTAFTSTTITDFISQSTTIGDLTVNVIDGPGVDTERSPDEILALYIELVQNALKLCDYKFSALLIVLIYGHRFTKQEREMIKIIKEILGENVFRRFGVCVITHGDDFQDDFEEEEISFEDWCGQQQGGIKTLFQDCNNRCVLFNNRTKDPAVKEMQVNKLLEYVSVGHYYSQSDINAVFKNLQKLMVETKAPKHLEGTMAFVKEKSKLVGQTVTVEDQESKNAAYAQILNDAENFEQSLIDTYGGPENIKQPLMETKILRMELNTERKKFDVKKLGQNEGSSVMEWSQLKSNDKDHYRGNNKMMKTTVSTANNVGTKSSLEETDIDFLQEDDTNTTLNDNVAHTSEKIVKEIIENINIFRIKIEKLKIDQKDDKKIWTDLRSEFDRKEKVWKSQIVHLSHGSREKVDVHIFSIRGIFSELAPKDGNFIVSPMHPIFKML